MRYLAAAAFFILAGSATAAELFRYRGAAGDGGTLEYIFETDQRDVPATVTKDKVAEIAAEFMTTLSCSNRCTGDPGASDRADTVLASLFFGHHQGTVAPIVLCRRHAGRNNH